MVAGGERLIKHGFFSPLKLLTERRGRRKGEEKEGGGEKGVGSSREEGGTLFPSPDLVLGHVTCFGQ